MDKEEFIELENQWFYEISGIVFGRKTRECLSEFLTALNSQNNKAIESTIVCQALDILLTCSSEFTETINVGNKYYRSRIINPNHLTSVEWGIGKQNNSFCGYDAYNSKEPPLGISLEGRNNILGSSYLYLSEDEYTACAEVNPKVNDYISLAEFILERPLRLIDFSENKKTEVLRQFETENKFSAFRLVSMIIQQYSTPSNNENIYKMTQYVSDRIRKLGYDGIKYRSSKTNHINLTVFNCHSSFVKFTNSRLMYCKSNIPIIYDLSAERVLPCVPEGTVSQDISRIKEDLNNKLKELS